MKYYQVTVDTNYVAPVPVGWYGKIDRKTRIEKKSYQIPKHLIFQVESHMQMVFTDIITFPCFMVSKLVRDTIGLYNPSVKFVRVVLYDKERKKSMAYYMPFVKTIDFLRTNNKISLEREKVAGEVILEVVDKGKTHIIMRMDLLESTLRRGAIGFGIEEIQMI